jgi:hypothetical protein
VSKLDRMRLFGAEWKLGLGFYLLWEGPIPGVVRRFLHNVPNSVEYVRVSLSVCAACTRRMAVIMTESARDFETISARA